MAYNIFAGWAEQDTNYDTAESTMEQFARVYGDSDLVHRHAGEPRQLLGGLDPEDQFYKADMGEGSLVLGLAYTGQGKLLKHALGSVVDSGPGPYLHTHSLAATLPANGLTVELHKGLPDSGFESKILTGGKIRTLAIRAQVDEETRATYGLLGKKVDLGPVSGSPTFPDMTAHAVNPTQIVVAIDGSAADVFGVEFTLDNILRDDRVFLGSAYIAEPKRAAGKRQITGRISKEWSSKALYDKFLAGTTASLLLTMTGPTGYSMTIRMAKIRIEEPEEETNEIQEIPQTLPFRAFLDGTYGALQIVETNATATT